MVQASVSSGTRTHRYAAKVEKGENAWRREWSSFMSGVSLRDLRKGGGVVLPKVADLEVAGSSNVTGGNFSYLFVSPAEKRAERIAKRQAEEEKRAKRVLERKCANDPLAGLSKHERAVWEARQRGLFTDGMTRKELRQFLHLTISKEQQEAEMQQEKFRLHELMDKKLEWYQQGPHPIDLISEKLVTRKAAKKGKLLGLRYNYLMPHPSWLAKRQQRRRESLLVGLGRRFVFGEEGDMFDEFGNRVVTLPEPKEPLMEKTDEVIEIRISKERTENLKEKDVCVAPPSMLGPESLVDPQKAVHSLVRAVVRDRNVASAIQHANLSTSYISSSLVMGPSLDPINDSENPEPVRKAPTRRVKISEARKRRATFEP